jgi:hypothetical protein
MSVLRPKENSFSTPDFFLHLFISRIDSGTMVRTTNEQRREWVEGVKYGCMDRKSNKPRSEGSY